MLLNVLPIIDLHEFDPSKNSFETLGLNINYQELDDIHKLISFNEINSPHFICIDFRSTENINTDEFNQKINSLILFSFNINYVKIDNTPIIVLLTNSSVANEMIVLTKTEFIKQGYPDVLLYELKENENNLTNSSTCFYGSNSYDEKELSTLYNLFTSKAIIDKKFFIHAPLAGINELITAISNVEKSFASNEETLYSLFLEIQNLNAQNSRLMNENTELKEKIDNGEINLSLLRKDAEFIINWNKEELNNIKNWYNLQYETLPLWYKRVGHLLKKILK